MGHQTSVFWAIPTSQGALLNSNHISSESRVPGNERDPLCGLPRSVTSWNDPPSAQGPWWHSKTWRLFPLSGRWHLTAARRTADISAGKFREVSFGKALLSSCTGAYAFDIPLLKRLLSVSSQKRCRWNNTGRDAVESTSDAFCCSVTEHYRSTFIVVSC